MRKLGLASVALIAAAGASVATEKHPSLNCTLESQHLSTSGEATWIGLESGNSITLTLTDINLERLTARIAQSPASGEVRMVQGHGSLTFVETTKDGGVLTTTVRTGVSGAGDRPINAAHSRHVIMPDAEVLVTQYVGFCALEP